MRGAHQRPKLLAQKGGPVETDANGAPTHGRVLVRRLMPIWQSLVAANIEGAEDDSPSCCLVENAAIELGLAWHVGEARAHHERDLGAIEADAIGAGFGELAQIDQ